MVVPFMRWGNLEPRTLSCAYENDLQISKWRWEMPERPLDQKSGTRERHEGRRHHLMAVFIVNGLGSHF